MTQENKDTGRCFCGDVQFSLSGSPELMAYCHCDSCRHWSAGQVSAFTLWKPESLHITQGKDCISSFKKNPGSEDVTVHSERKWCKNCGGHVFTDHPGMGLIDVPASILSKIDFTPAFHVHYQNTVQPMQDGLPKFRDLPAEAGGSGDLLEE